MTFICCSVIDTRIQTSPELLTDTDGELVQYGERKRPEPP